MQVSDTKYLRAISAGCFIALGGYTAYAVSDMKALTAPVVATLVICGLSLIIGAIAVLRGLSAGLNA